jgi:hypothetical protein
VEIEDIFVVGILKGHVEMALITDKILNLWGLNALAKKEGT